MKILIALATLAGVAFGAGPIDLDRPGNLEAIQREHPEHAVKIAQILAQAPKRAMDTKGMPGWLQTDFGARDVRYTEFLKTSFPPKKRLDFTLDDIAYTKVITVESRGEYQRIGNQLVQAARAGDCRAAKRLGDIYLRGEGVAPDRVEAEKWYNAARTLGC